MAKLTDAEKQEIVTLLAQFCSPADVVVHMRANYGIEIDRFQVRAYDPTNSRYEGGAKWRPIFEQARSAYLKAIEDIPIAQPAFRLNELQRNYFRARDSGNLVLANKILWQAAMETKRIPSSDSRKDTHELYYPYNLTPEERRAELVRIFERALDRRGVDQAGHEAHSH
ncbi:DUF2280 domain-containing protein [Allosphingosinicella flava]|uniref:DUF2280 domain-containing protein n=1 Tax=Allosphingosinicella flava TaxID=2771430 RepID=A0A7T2LLH6_9SPHN|nr:DUF2280 domain-containing protein [Sphingosinicella flava]QPQ54383.1 DUF2280 domain-containing protein [Sphingosinicella flava]